MNQPARTPWGWRLWIIASLLFLVAAAIHPEQRAGSLSLAVVFGILGLAIRARSTDGARAR